MLFSSSHRSSGPHRVVVTGAGIVTPLGCGWTENASGFRAGRQTFAPVTLFDVSKQRARIAAEIHNLEACASPNRCLKVRRLERGAKMLLLAAAEATNQAGWAGAANIPIILGSTSGGMTLGETFYRQSLQSPPTRRNQPSRVLHYQPQQQGLDVARALGYSGPITIVANACASGANAIGLAWQAVRRGDAERVLTGGYDALSQLVFAGFDSLQALSPTGCRPFDQGRDGLTLGEGAGVLAVESLASARARGAQILGEIAGYGCAMDVHHLTQPHPQGEAALSAMQIACERAAVQPAEIGYINAHGTGTPLNDAAEASAINTWAGAAAARMQVSSTKASIGHTLGAAGALEAIICLMALREQWLPPMPIVQNPDPACKFQLVTSPRTEHLEYALTNSFGFGGANATLILRRSHE